MLGPSGGCSILFLSAKGERSDSVRVAKGRKNFGIFLTSETDPRGNRTIQNDNSLESSMPQVQLDDQVFKVA